VLPPSHRLIFDEAHSLEKSATSFFSERYNKLLLFKQLGRLYGRRQRRAYGLALRLQKMSSAPEIFERIPSLVQELQKEAEALDTGLLGFLNGRSSLWLKPDSESDAFESVLGPVRAVRRALGTLLTNLDEGINRIEEKYEQETEVFEIGIVQERLALLSAVLGAIERYQDEEESVCWIEKSRTSKREEYCSFIRTPLRIASLMQEAVFEPHRTVVSTSATLTVRKTFDFWLARVGLNGAFRERLDTAMLESPFEYRKRVLLAVPVDAPEPNRERYQPYVTEFIRDAIELSEGGALVLFTSYRMLQTSYEETREFLEERGISVLKQGGEDRSKLLQRFHTDISSVLMATDSFWEGVDAPGESLKLVIICRLPFSVPTDPVIQARMEMVEREGGNAFMQFALPQAAMKLRQGFGRLMRRQSDRGVVAILDSRIIRKSYGKVLLDSLPMTQRKIDEREHVLRAMEDFFYKQDGA
jgi:ATP-dependent DNA helicase DinG